MNLDEAANARYPQMLNRAMARKLVEGDCLDVLGKTVGGEMLEAGVYRLKNYIDGVDYCDASRELWIWSIGRNRTTGELRAATDGRYYQDPDVECIWLR